MPTRGQNIYLKEGILIPTFSSVRSSLKQVQLELDTFMLRRMQLLSLLPKKGDVEQTVHADIL